MTIQNRTTIKNPNYNNSADTVRFIPSPVPDATKLKQEYEAELNSSGSAKSGDDWKGNDPQTITNIAKATPTPPSHEQDDQ
jgi:hypothetical protein